MSAAANGEAEAILTRGSQTGTGGIDSLCAAPKEVLAEMKKLPSVQPWLLLVGSSQP